jgi:hypothetical protein
MSGSRKAFLEWGFRFGKLCLSPFWREPDAVLGYAQWHDLEAVLVRGGDYVLRGDDGDFVLDAAAAEDQAETKPVSHSVASGRA